MMGSRRDAVAQRSEWVFGSDRCRFITVFFSVSAPPRLCVKTFSEMNSRGDAETRRDLNAISGRIVDAAVHVHTKLGPGLLESIYERVLAHELEKRGLAVKRQVTVPIVYDDIHFEEGFRADLIVEESVIVELKSVETVAPVHAKQLQTYLKLMDYRLGLLINFGAPLLKDGIKRIVNDF